MKKSKNIENSLYIILPLLVLLAGWEIWVRTFEVKTYILPSPSLIAITLYQALPAMNRHLYTTVGTALTGFCIAIITAFMLAVLMDSVHAMKRILYPYIIVSQTIPIIFIYPLFLIWFGFGMLPKIIVVTLVCFFPIVVNFMDGLDKIDGELLDLFRSMGSSNRETFFMVKLPGAMPGFFSGLKISATYSIMGAVIAEWLGAQYGMGIYMIRSYKTFATPRVFAAIIVVVALSIAVFQFVRICERFFMPWYNEKDSK